MLGGQEAEMATVEERTSYIEGRLDQFATKADLAQLEIRLTVRMVVIQLAGLGAVAAIMRFLD